MCEGNYQISLLVINKIFLNRNEFYEEYKISIQRSATTHSFRFGSGKVVTLDEHQINRIPYLARLVSSADRFVGARVEEGHCQTRSTDRSQILPLTPSKSVRRRSLQELVAQLPLKHDVTAVIAHLDFLGLVDHGKSDFE